MSNNDYVIFIKKKRGDFKPVDSAETKDEGIEAAKAYLESSKVLEAEVVYMPEDDYDVEEVVWNSSSDLVENTEEEQAEESSLIENTEEESAWSEEEVRAELIKMTNNFKKNEGEITTWYEEEKGHIKNILDAAGYQVEVSDGRKDKDDDMHWVITFVKKVNENLAENSNAKLSLELIDNDEDNMVAAYKVSSGKDALSLAVETIGYESGFKVRKEDIEKLEVVSSLSEGTDITDVFIDIDDNKDLIYCGKFNSSDYTNIDKIIEVINDWSKGGATIKESLKESKLMSLEDVLNSPGSTNIDNLELLLQKNGYKVTSKKLINSTNIGTSIPRYKNVYELILDNGKKVISVQHYDSNNVEDGFDNPKPYIKESLNEQIDPIKAVLKDIDKAKKKLIGKSPVENFGQNEVRKLRDKYFKYKYGHYSKVFDLINEFEDWCATYTGPARGPVCERVDSSHLNRKTEEDTNISIDKVEIDVDTLNTKTKKIDEDLAFDKDKKLTIREMYDFLLKSGMANGCDIILDWDNDSDLSDPKTAIEWLDLIIETYYDLDSDLRYMNANDEAERNMDQVIVPLEDFRNELNEKGLTQLNNIYYQVISYNHDSGDDDFDDYTTYGAAEAAFENWVNDYKEDGVDGAVELLQVDDNKRTSKQLKYWSSEDDNAWKFNESLSNNCCDYQAAYEKLDKFMSDSEEDMNKFYNAKTKEDLLDVLENAIIDEDTFVSYAGEDATLEGFAEYILDNKLNESIQEETVMDYGCDICGKRVPEDKIHWFYGAEVGLCNDCYDTMTDEERYQLDDGDFSSLKEANKTKAQRHNDMMNKMFDNAKKQNQILKDILKDNGISEEEIGELEKATGLHGSALHKKVYDLGLNNEFTKRLGLKEDLTENHLKLDGDTLDTIKDFINGAFEYMREDEVELSDEVILYATPTRDRENNQEVTFDVIENDVILDSVVGYPGNTEYCYETIISILKEQTGLVKMSEAKEEGEDNSEAYSEILNAKIKVNPNRHPADEKMFSSTYFIGTYEEGGLAGSEYVFVLADSEGHRFMNEYMGYPKDEHGYVDQPTDVITLNGQDNVYFMVEPEELFKEKVEESITMNEGVNTSELVSFLKKAYNDLTNQGEGTWYFDLGNDLYFVMAAAGDPYNYDKEDLEIFARSYDQLDEEELAEENPEYNLVVMGKIAVNNSDLQADYDYDWTMPYEEDGDVWDTEREFYKQENFEQVAKEILAEYNKMKDLRISPDGVILADGEALDSDGPFTVRVDDTESFDITDIYTFKNAKDYFNEYKEQGFAKNLKLLDGDYNIIISYDNPNYDENKRMGDFKIYFTEEDGSKDYEPFWGELLPDVIAKFNEWKESGDYIELRLEDENSEEVLLSYTGSKDDSTVSESIVMNENTGDPDFELIEDKLLEIKGTSKVEFDYRPYDGVYKNPEDHFIVLVFNDDTEFGDGYDYFKNYANWKREVVNTLKVLGWKLEDPLEDNGSYLYLVMEKIKPEVKTEGYETLDNNKVEVYSDYETAKSRALMLGLKEAEYGDEFGSDISYCAWNKSGDRNEEVEVLAYYKFENGKPVALTDEEKATVESVKELTFDDITGPISEAISDGVEKAIAEFTSTYKSSLEPDVFNQAIADMKKVNSYWDAKDIGSIYSNLNFYKFKNSGEVVGHGGVKDKYFTLGDRKYPTALDRDADKIYFDMKAAKPYLDKIIHKVKNESLSLTESSLQKGEYKISDTESLTWGWEKGYNGGSFYVEKVYLPSKESEMWSTEFHKTYATEEAARRAFNRYKKQYSLTEDVSSSKQAIVQQFNNKMAELCKEKGYLGEAEIKAEMQKYLNKVDTSKIYQSNFVYDFVDEMVAKNGANIDGEVRDDLEDYYLNIVYSDDDFCTKLDACIIDESWTYSPEEFGLTDEDIKALPTIYGYIAHSDMTDITHIVFSKDRKNLVGIEARFDELLDFAGDSDYEDATQNIVKDLENKGVYIINSEGPFSGREINQYELDDGTLVWVLTDTNEGKDYKVEEVGYDSWRF